MGARKARSHSEKFLVQPKYDGISAEYEGGVLASRGDGYVGGNLTSRLPLIEFVTEKRDFGFLLGELVVPNRWFETRFPRYRTKSGSPFKNPRNTVAGVMGCDDVDFYLSQGVRIQLVDYDRYSWIVTAADFEESWPELVRQIRRLDYPMDGIVVKLADTDYAKSLGATEHHPRGQIAFKFSNQTRVSEITNIEITQGKEVLSAVAVVKPIDFDGVTVRRVKIPVTRPADRDLPCLIDGGIAIGDTIEIERSGDVVPNVVSVVRGDSRRLLRLEKCPFCGAELEIRPTSVRCVNADCFEKRLNRLLFSLETLGFLGVGKSILSSIMKQGGVRDIVDFFSLTPEKLEEIGITPGIARNIIGEITRLRKNTRTSVLTALNVPSLGVAASKLLLERFSMEEILTGLTSDRLTAIRGIGEITAREIVDGIASDRARLLKTVSLFEFEDDGGTPPSRGAVCFTGKVSRTRPEMEAVARAKGFIPVDGVSRNLSILVVGENAGSKLARAERLGVRIVDEEEFMRL